MSKNQHMVPPIVVDIGEAVCNNALQSHIKENYIQRLEAIIDYSQAIINKSRMLKKGK